MSTPSKARRAIVVGGEDATGVIYLSEGQHRMNAALEIFEETGDPQWVTGLIEAARESEHSFGRQFLVTVDDATDAVQTGGMANMRLPRRTPVKPGLE